MQPALVGFLFGLTVLAGLCFYFAYWTNGRQWVSYRAQAGFWLILLMLIPAIGYTLVQQQRASWQLEELGIAHFPGIKAVSGLPINPQTLEGLERLMKGSGTEGIKIRDYLWVFSLRTSAADALEFYRQPENLDGWRLLEDSGILLVYERRGWRLAIGGSDWTGSSLHLMLTPPSADEL